MTEKHTKKQKENFQTRKVVYGVTDRRNDPLLVKLNDFLIDNSPVSVKQKSILFESLQLLVGSGVTFMRALEILGDRQRNLRLKRVLHSIVHDMVQNGISFSAAMGKYPNIFHESEIKMMYSGEVAGKIEERLEAIATGIKKSLELQLKVRSALLYPITVIVAILVAAVVVLVFVVPRFKVLFAEFPGSELPFSTQILMNSSTFMQKYWWFLCAFFIGGWFLFQNWKRSHKGKRKWDGLVLKLPLLKSMINNLQTVRIASNLSTLLHSGMPVLKSLRLLGETMPNSVIAEAIFDIERGVAKGETMYGCFQEKEVLDPILAEVIEIGEKGGKVPESLEKTAAQYEMEVDGQFNNLTTLIQPAIILVVGGAVVFMAMAIMTPIFRLQELFSGA